MRRDMNSDDASQGISAMIIFVSIILMCSIISAVVIGFGEKVFAETKTDAQENIPSFKGIVNIVVFEISSLGADDELISCLSCLISNKILVIQMLHGL